MAIRVIAPFSLPSQVHLERNLLELQEILDMPVACDDLAIFDEESEFTSHSMAIRGARLKISLESNDLKILWAGRGGYGAQGLLPFIDLDRLRHCQPKILVGFSDMTALQMHLWDKLRWPSLHGPMLGTAFWQTSQADAQLVIALLRNEAPAEVALDLVPLNAKESSSKGTLLGGCFSVLTSMIGTPYQPNLANSILFLEEIGEPPGRMLRWLDQWRQAGLFSDVKALVLGNFAQCEDEPRGVDAMRLKEFMASRLEIPVFSCDQFGHTPFNMPLGIGCRAAIDGGKLIWTTGDLYG